MRGNLTTVHHPPPRRITFLSYTPSSVHICVAGGDVDDILYTWNWDGKLRKAIKDGTTLMHVKYDPAGNRIFKESATAGTRKYIVDIVGDLPVILLELDADNDNNITKMYTYANSQILAQHDGDSSASRYFYMHDRLGSVRQILDSDGEVVKYYTYKPFGQLFEETGTFENPFRFTGQYYDTEIEQYYLRARQYDPGLFRFVSRDPVLGSFKQPMTLHKYLYCGNDAINWMDPSGLDKYLIFDWGHIYVAVDVWEDGRVIGQRRYDFSAPHTWYFFLGLLLIEGEINTDSLDVGTLQEDSLLNSLTFVWQKEQSQKADKRMETFLNYQMENPPLYNVGWHNCWHWSFINYLLDYEDNE